MAALKREELLAESIDEVIPQLQDVADLLTNIVDSADKESREELRADLIDVLSEAMPNVQLVLDRMKRFDV